MSSILSAACRLSRSPIILNALRKQPQSNKLWRHFSSAVEPKPTPTAEKPINIHTPGARSHPVDNLERRMLVWCGKYKTVEEVPSMVNQEVMEKVRNKVRIRMANIMMLLTAIGKSISLYHLLLIKYSLIFRLHRDDMEWQESGWPRRVCPKSKY